jgi:ligand-binding sensor domain-containing protein/signal transduction histidine kinase
MVVLRILTKFCLLWALVAFMPLLWAEPLIVGNGPQFTRDLWRVSEGLPEDTVQAVAVSRDGILWIGSTGGLAHFDGFHMQAYGGGPFPVLPVNSIFCLAADADGGLWAGTEGGGLIHIRGNSIKRYSVYEGLTDGFVRSILLDSQNRLWVGTDDGLFRMEQGHLRRLDRKDGIAPIAVHALAEDRQHRIWVGGSRLMAIDPDGTARKYELPGAYSENRVKTIVEDHDGKIWVGTVRGLQYLENRKFHVIQGIHATVRSLLPGSDGTLWVGTIGQGLWRVRGGRVSQSMSRGLLPSQTVLSLLEDPQKQIWVGTQAGLVRLQQSPIHMIPLPEGNDPDFETISGDVQGNLWVAAQSLYLLHDGVANPVHYKEIAGAKIRNVFRSRDGALWLGTDGEGAFRLGEKGVNHYSAPKDLTNNFIRGFLENRSGEIWIATDEGINRLKDDKVQKLGEADGLAYFSVRCLMEDRKGQIWIGTERGLSLWRDGRFLQNAATRALAQEKVWSILEDRRGTLWLATRDHGLFRVRNDVVEQFTTWQGLPTNSFYQLLQDKSGVFWMTGPNIIASATESEMERSVPTPDHPLGITVLRMPYGAENAQIYGGRQPAGYVAPDNSVWFPTNRGAAQIVSRTQSATSGPRAILEQIVADGNRVPLSDEAHLPAQVSRLGFGFSAIFLRSQQDVRFRYKLENFDREWSLAGSTRAALYTNLPAGRYRFRLIAFDAAQPDKASEVSILVVKAPFFYQTWWFYTLGVLLLAAVGWTIYQIRVAQIRTRFTAVLEERNRLAREMHDTVIQGCTGISALLEAIASTPVTNQSAQKKLLDVAREQARRTIDGARDAVWDLRHERETEVELVTAIQAVAEQTMREFGNTVTMKSDGKPIKVPASISHEILMTAREAIYNSVQHSGARSVEITMLTSGLSVTIAIVDYGSGFIDLGQEGHYGILGMRERMRRAGGEFDLMSVPGKGTRITLSLKRSTKPQRRKPD